MDGSAAADRAHLREDGPAAGVRGGERWARDPAGGAVYRGGA
jgi:hypothetical protein